MNKVALDSNLVAKLSAPAELTDQAGDTIGFVVTPSEYQSVRKKLEQRRRDYEWAHSVFTG